MPRYIFHLAWRVAAAIALAAPAAAIPDAARADLMIDLPNQEFLSDGVNPTVGVIEVTLTLFDPTPDDPPPPPPSIGSFNLDINVVSLLVFLDAPQTPTDDAVPLFTTGTFASTTTGQNVKAAHDLFGPLPSSVPAFNGAGLVKIAFTVAPGELGTFVLDFGALNQIADGSATPLPVTLVSGAITIISAIPETNGWMQFGAAAATIGLGKGVALARRRRFLTR